MPAYVPKKNVITCCYFFVLRQKWQFAQQGYVLLSDWQSVMPLERFKAETNILKMSITLPGKSIFHLVCCLQHYLF